MSIFENIPPWSQQPPQQQSMFNPAPQIMSPYQHGASMGAPMPAMPVPNPTSQPQDIGTQIQSLLGSNPNSSSNPNNSNNPMAASMGSGGLLQLLAALQNGRGQLTDATGATAPSHIDVTGSQMGGGGIMQALMGLLKGIGGG